MFASDDYAEIGKRVFRKAVETREIDSVLVDAMVRAESQNEILRDWIHIYEVDMRARDIDAILGDEDAR